ncbi:Rieske (2Fe-2S) protein [Rhodococcus sp. (in: high G+C Gram-positive bacteria)]|uniref:Rieske (2Fe-2S) protein n=1 Tax=Rhodococcus sp. TaxID=1831 RepID=UPI00388E61F2
MSFASSDRTSVPRRTVLGGAGAAAAVAALAACGASTDTAGDPPQAQPPTTTAPPGPDAQVVAAVADVPVGGGVLIEGKRLVLTQPTEGDFCAFLALCTHQGCNITSVEGDTIVCACHGSKFALDGSVLQGPAKRPLKSRPVEARGTDLVVG